MNTRKHVNPGDPLRLAASQVNGLNALLNGDYGYKSSGLVAEPSRLVASVRVDVPSSFSDGIPPGIAVRITGANSTLTGQSAGSEPSGYLRVEHLTGQLTDIANYDAGIHGALGLTIDGTGGSIGSQAVLPCVISGLAVARVRRFDVSHRFAINPIRRISEPSNPAYLGILDSHPCACDSSVRVVSYGGVASSFTDATSAPLVWAVVIA